MLHTALVTGPVVVLCALVGLVVGSFLNVVVWRVPRGESVVRPASHCPGCAQPVRPRDNVPLLSFVLLGGRCRDCRARISARYPLVELLTAALFAGLAVRFGAHPALPAFLYLAAVSVALALIDLDVQRLPNVIVLPSYLVGAVLLALAALGQAAPADFLRAVEGMAACYVGYYLVALAYPAGMGFGDVKLAGVIGLYLGFLGWGPLAVGIFGGVLLGGLFSIGLLALGAGRKTAVPYGPFLLAGCFLGVFAGGPLADAYLRLSGV